MKGWRDEASGKLPPPLAGRDDSEAEDGPTRHANSDEDDVRDVLAYQGQTTTSQAGSPERRAPKKSYFDDIPTSSPGGALSRDAEMADDDDLAESLFGTAPRHQQFSQAGPSTTRAAPSTNAAVRMTTSEAGFNDADLTFELEEVDDFGMDAEAEAAMREMMDQNDMDDDFFNPGPTKGNKGKQPETGASKSASTVKPNAAISFYAEPKAAERAKIGKTLVEEAHRQVPSSSPAPKRHEAEMAGEENFDDFDFGAEEDDIMREMEAAEKKRKDREAAALAAEKRASSSSVIATVADMAASGSESTTTSCSKTPSLTASSSAQDVDLDLDDAFEEDEQFLRSMEEAELASSQKQASQGIAAGSVKQMSPIRASSPLKTPSAVSQEPHIVVAGPEEAALSGEEEEEDLYS